MLREPPLTAATPAATVRSATFNANRGNRYTLVTEPRSSSLTEVELIDELTNAPQYLENWRRRPQGACRSHPSSQSRCHAAAMCSGFIN